MAEIVPALPEEADALRIRQLAAIRRLLETVLANRRAGRLSGLRDTVKPRFELEEDGGERTQGGAR